jgi:hypothetical protein
MISHQLTLLLHRSVDFELTDDFCAGCCWVSVCPQREGKNALLAHMCTAAGEERELIFEPDSCTRALAAL